MIPLAVAMWDHVRDVGKYDARPCDVVATDWPYDCDAKRKNPNDVVFQCLTHQVWWHRPRTPLFVLEFREFAALIGAPDVLEDHGPFRLPGGVSKAQRRRLDRLVLDRLQRMEVARDHAREVYDWLVATGHIRTPTRVERLLKIAHGHPDLESVQAARRLLAKAGVKFDPARPSAGDESAACGEEPGRARGG